MSTDVVVHSARPSIRVAYSARWVVAFPSLAVLRGKIKIEVHIAIGRRIGQQERLQ